MTYTQVWYFIGIISSNGLRDVQGSPQKKTGYFMTSCKFQLPPTHLPYLNFLTNDSGIIPLVIISFRKQNHVLSLLPTHPFAGCHKISSFFLGASLSQTLIASKTFSVSQYVVKNAICICSRYTLNLSLIFLINEWMN